MAKDGRSQLLHEFVAHSSRINCVTFGSKSRQVVATGGDDKKVNLWRVTNACNFWSLSGSMSPITALRFNPNENYIVAGSEGGSVKVYDLEVGKTNRTVSGHMGAVTCIDYHPYGEFLLTGSVDTRFKIWDLRNRHCVVTYRGHSGEITTGRFSPDGQWCATSGRDGHLTLWDLRKKEVLHTFSVRPASITTFEFNPTELLVAAATSERIVRVWDSDSFELLVTTNPEPNPVKAMAYDTSDAERILTATDKTLRVSSGRTGKLLQQIDVGWEGVAALTVTDEGQVIAGAVQSSFLSLWAVELRPPDSSADAKPTQSNFVPTVRDSGSGLNGRSEAAHPPAKDEGSDGVRHVVGGPRGHGAKAIGLSRASSDSAVEVKPRREEGADIGEREGDWGERERDESRGGRCRTASREGRAVPKPESKVAERTEGSSEDVVLIEALSHRTVLTSTLSTRLTHLQLLAGMWARGDVAGAVTFMVQLYEEKGGNPGRLTVSADFLRVVDLRSEGVTLDIAIQLLPVLNGTLELKFQNHVLVGLKGVSTLIEVFGGYVSQVRSAPPISGVDLTGEERMRKCNRFHEGLLKTQALMGNAGDVLRGRHPELERSYGLLSEYFHRARVSR